MDLHVYIIIHEVTSRPSALTLSLMDLQLQVYITMHAGTFFPVDTRLHSLPLVR